MKQLKYLVLFIIGFSTFSVMAANKSVAISGTIYEKLNNSYIPLSLANVHCVGTVNGTTSSEQGDFTMNLKEGKYLVEFSYAGYGKITKEIVIKKRKNKTMYLEIVLEKRDNQLAEN